MGNSLRCCLACVLPCGALDLIRIVHINGYVEEYGQPVTAKEVLEANPNHVISRPCSQGGTRRIMIVSPDSELKRGSIYFLIPASALPAERRRRSGGTTTSMKAAGTAVEVPPDDGRREEHEGEELAPAAEEKGRGGRHHRRRSSHVEIWKPHLESIFED